MAIKKKAQPKKKDDDRIIVSFDPMSVARVSLVLYGSAGLLMAFVFALIHLSIGQNDEMGWGFIVIMPFAYGFGGALVVALSALLYNLVAARIGGIKVKVR